VLDSWSEVWLASEFANWSLDADLARVRCPLLAIHGDADEFGSEEFPRRIVARTCGRAELAILKHCGHVPHRERPDAVLHLAAAFLERGAKGATHFPLESSPD
jgi:pimeloyl-ACP methyl ester carboxylesterase